MNRLLTPFIASCCSMLSSVAVAQDCTNHVNTQIAPVAFADAAQSLTGGVSLQKDEFETTAQYEARVGAAGGSRASSLWITVPMDLEYVTYDADRGVFSIQTFALKNENIDWFTALYGTPHYGTVRTGSSNVDIVVSSNDRVTGSYQGRNAYGAEWEVSEIDRTIEAVFEREISYGQSLFPNSTAWTIPVPVDQARGYKERLRAAVLVEPRAPFYVENSQRGPGRITIQNPRDVTQISRVIFADFKCAVVTDDANNVLLAIRTN